jgi:hypothetical protein
VLQKRLIEALEESDADEVPEGEDAAKGVKHKLVEPGTEKQMNGYVSLKVTCIEVVGEEEDDDEDPTLDASGVVDAAGNWGGDSDMELPEGTEDTEDEETEEAAPPRRTSRRRKIIDSQDEDDSTGVQAAVEKQEAAEATVDLTDTSAEAKESGNATRLSVRPGEAAATPSDARSPQIGDVAQSLNDEVPWNATEEDEDDEPTEAADNASLSTPAVDEVKPIEGTVEAIQTLQDSLPVVSDDQKPAVVSTKDVDDSGSDQGGRAATKALDQEPMLPPAADGTPAEDASKTSSHEDSTSATIDDNGNNDSSDENVNNASNNDNIDNDGDGDDDNGAHPPEPEKGQSAPEEEPSVPFGDTQDLLSSAPVVQAPPPRRTRDRRSSATAEESDLGDFGDTQLLGTPTQEVATTVKKKEKKEKKLEKEEEPRSSRRTSRRAASSEAGLKATTSKRSRQSLEVVQDLEAPATPAEEPPAKMVKATAAAEADEGEEVDKPLSRRTSTTSSRKTSSRKAAATKRSKRLAQSPESQDSEAPSAAKRSSRRTSTQPSAAKRNSSQVVVEQEDEQTPLRAKR